MVQTRWILGLWWFDGLRGQIKVIVKILSCRLTSGSMCWISKLWPRASSRTEILTQSKYLSSSQTQWQKSPGLVQLHDYTGRWLVCALTSLFNKMKCCLKSFIILILSVKECLGHRMKQKELLLPKCMLFLRHLSHALVFIMIYKLAFFINCMKLINLTSWDPSCSF